MMSCDAFRHSNPDVKPVIELAKRTVGSEAAKQFVFELERDSCKKDHFAINSRGKQIVIKGNSPIALSSGLNWYLKYETNSHISWEAQQINLSAEFPQLNKAILKNSPFEYSYYLNYCTFNYSMAFWSWERWEKELDWMALNGINLPLAIVGTEAIWKNTLERLNYTKGEIEAFIPGPAFNAWWLMGNLEGWGGPLSDQYITQQSRITEKNS